MSQPDAPSYVRTLKTCGYRRYAPETPKVVIPVSRAKFNSGAVRYSKLPRTLRCCYTVCRRRLPEATDVYTFAADRFP